MHVTVTATMLSMLTVPLLLLLAVTAEAGSAVKVSDPPPDGKVVVVDKGHDKGANQPSLSGSKDSSVVKSAKQLAGSSGGGGDAGSALLPTDGVAAAKQPPPLPPPSESSSSEGMSTDASTTEKTDGESAGETQGSKRVDSTNSDDTKPPVSLGGSTTVTGTGSDPYSNANTCISQTPGLKLPESVVYPSDAEAHFQELLTATAPFRAPQIAVSQHNHKEGWTGPYLENMWTESFKDKPLSAFGTYIPILINFVDTQTADNEGKTAKRMCETVLPMLRDDVLYVTVSQHAAGMPRCLREHFRGKGNIVVLSGGGVGNVPLPLLPGKPALDLVVGGKENKVAWIPGDTDMGLRTAAANSFAGRLGDKFHKFEPIHDAAIYEMQTGQLAFGLAPRGIGRQSFRMWEIAQSGSIPVYVWEEAEWLPYKGTIDWISGEGTSDELLQQLTDRVKRLVDDDGANDREKLLKQIQDHHELFTMSGVQKQIEMFLVDPERSALRCDVYKEMPCLSVYTWPSSIYKEVC